MSIRTLIEFNHDHAVHELETNPDRAVADLLKILRDYTTARRDSIYSNSFKAKHQRHHSDDCPIDGQC